MNLIVCVDDRLGMAFNHRRQSQDRELRKALLELTAGHRLWMRPYSSKQFAQEAGENIHSAEDYLTRAEADDYCFAEIDDVSALEPDKLVLCRWGRHYPADLRFTMDLSSWTLESSREIVGSSHETITMEVYGR